MSMAKMEAPSYYLLLLETMSKRRTWVCILVLVYGFLFTCSWNFLKSVILWYESSTSSWWPALYASVALGTVFGVLSMAAALAVVVPAMVVTWIAVVVLLAFLGKPRKTLVVEGRKITREILSFVMRVLLRKGNAVAAVCAVLGYFALGRTCKGGD
ncbi:hypothetical protein Fmac_019281 [Flemingia macrophylla]|uniref:Pyrroline-5-carboxylate reductase n=1 Tax=Flemingia macrophylla TaxID=520843 RepID=A0ABD1M9A8_9FABA